MAFDPMLFFCDRDMSRSGIFLTPWVFSGWRYATDRAIVIRRRAYVGEEAAEHARPRPLFPRFSTHFPRARPHCSFQKTRKRSNAKHVTEWER